MPLSDAYANTVNDVTLTGSLTLALFTSEPTGDTGGTEVSSTGTGYARQSVAWNASSAKSATNNGAVTFPVALAAYAAPVSWVAVYSGATRRRTAQLTVPRTVGMGDILNFANLSITMDAL